MQSWSRHGLLWMAWAIAGAGACSKDDVHAGESVSEACIECLSERTQKGCAESFAACEARRSCDEYVFCQLSGRCFEQPSTARCEEELGCELPPDVSPVEAGDDAGASEPTERDLARALEKCARSTCAATCGFVK